MYNKYYNDVTINHDTPSLEQLQIDSDLTNLITMTVSSDELEIPTDHKGDPSNSHMHSTFVPAATTGFTEQQAIHQSVMDQHVDWPQQYSHLHIILQSEHQETLQDTQVSAYPDYAQC